MSRCKLCNAQLKDAETKCSYCGTLVCKGDVVYHKSAERKKEIVLNVLKQTFGEEFIIEKTSWTSYWKIFTTETIEGTVTSGFFRRKQRKVKKVEKVCIISVSMSITDKSWSHYGTTIESYFEEYNERAKQIGEKLSEYTKVEVVLR